MHFDHIHPYPAHPQGSTPLPYLLSLISSLLKTLHFQFLLAVYFVCGHALASLFYARSMSLKKTNSLSPDN